MAIEIERKYLVNLPKKWQELNDLFDRLVDIKRITQVYLIPENGSSARVRKTVEGFADNLKTVYHFNKKTHISPGVNEEEEFEISEREYNEMIEFKHDDQRKLNKVRYLFDYHDQLFELDIFSGPLAGLAILEIELKNENDVVELPAFLNISKEVTKEKKYSNFELASKK